MAAEEAERGRRHRRGTASDVLICRRSKATRSRALRPLGMAGCHLVPQRRARSGLDPHPDHEPDGRPPTKAGVWGAGATLPAGPGLVASPDASPPRMKVRSFFESGGAGPCPTRMGCGRSGSPRPDWCDDPSRCRGVCSCRGGAQAGGVMACWTSWETSSPTARVPPYIQTLVVERARSWR